MERSNEEKRIEPSSRFHFELTIDKPSIGIALEPAIGGSSVPICAKGFLTPKDGQLLYDALDGISATFLADWKRTSRNDEKLISNCLILEKNGKAQVYINVPVVAQIVSKRAIRSGEWLTREDIADLRGIEFQGVKLESDCGIIFIFSFGWRRYLYFDFTPLLPRNHSDSTSEKYLQPSLDKIAPSLFSMVLFPELYQIKPQLMEKVFELGWFPFIRILGSKFNEVCNYIENNFPMDQIEAKIIDSFDGATIKEMVDSWIGKEAFKKDEAILKAGVDNFLRKDYIASIHILYPRIEGMMRRLYLGENEKPSQGRLVNRLIELAKGNNPNSCLYFQDLFSRYLKEFYFANFDLESGTVGLSRHSVGHGVVNVEQLDRKRAFQAILILDQMFFYV